MLMVDIKYKGTFYILEEVTSQFSKLWFITIIFAWRGFISGLTSRLTNFVSTPWSDRNLFDIVAHSNIRTVEAPQNMWLKTKQSLNPTIFGTKDILKYNVRLYEILSIVKKDCWIIGQSHNYI